MPKIRIHRCPSLTEEELAALQALLEAAGFSPLEEEEPDEWRQDEGADLEGDAGDEGDDDEVLIVVLYPDCDADGSLETEAGRVGRGGGRVVGVWPRGAAGSHLPAPLQKYGTDSCPWDAGEIRRVIDRSEKPQWKDAAGTPSPNRPMNANTKC